MKIQFFYIYVHQHDPTYINAVLCTRCKEIKEAVLLDIVSTWSSISLSFQHLGEIRRGETTAFVVNLTFNGCQMFRGPGDGGEGTPPAPQPPLSLLQYFSSCVVTTYKVGSLFQICHRDVAIARSHEGQRHFKVNLKEKKDLHIC